MQRLKNLGGREPAVKQIVMWPRRREASAANRSSRWRDRMVESFFVAANRLGHAARLMSYHVGQPRRLDRVIGHYAIKQTRTFTPVACYAKRDSANATEAPLDDGICPYGTRSPSPENETASEGVGSWDV